MLKFRFLLWAFTKLLRRAVRKSPDAAAYVRGKNLTFQIRTASGVGRYFVIQNGVMRSFAGLTANPQFTFTFKDAGKGFKILSAKDSQAAFLRGLGNKDLVVSGDFLAVMWFQGLADFVNPKKVISPYDRTAPTA